MAELHDALRALWDERHSRRPDHLHVKHVVRHIVYNVVVRLTDADRMRSQGLSPGDREQLRRVLDEGGWATVQQLVQLASAYAGGTLERFRALPGERRPQHLIPERISERACTDVGAAHRRLHLAAGPELLAAVASGQERFEDGERARAPRMRTLLGREQFEQRYAAYYETAWRGRDAARHEADPPWRLGLGDLPRPPLGGREHGGWRAGSDRPVHARYRHYASDRGAARLDETAGQMRLPAAQHMSARLLHLDPDVPARTEVDRATEPLGLRFDAHRALLHAVRDAVLLADLETSVRERKAVQDRRRPLELWCRAHLDLPDTADDHLIRVLGAACASASARYGAVLALSGRDARRRHRPRTDDPDGGAEEEFAADALVRHTGDDAGGRALWTDQVELGVLRRLWLELLKCELEWDAALTPARLPTLLGAMFADHLTELGTRPLRRPEPPAADEHAVVVATVAELGTDLAELARGVLADEPGWRARYTSRLRHATGRRLLDAAAFRAWVVANAAFPDRGEPDDLDEPDDALDLDDEGGA